MPICLSTHSHTHTSHTYHTQMQAQPSMSAVPNLIDTRDRFHERQFFHRLWGVGMVSRWFKHITFTRPPHRWSEGSRAQEVMQAMGSSYKYRWNFSHLPAIHLLLCSLVPAGQGPVAVCGPVVGDCWLKQQRFIFSQFWSLEFQDQVSAGLLSSEPSLLSL